MATGYTSIFADKDISFKEFVERCTGAFLIQQRDEPMGDKPKSRDFSSYYVNRLNEENAKLVNLLTLTPNECNTTILGRTRKV